MFAKNNISIGIFGVLNFAAAGCSGDNEEEPSPIFCLERNSVSSFKYLLFAGFITSTRLGCVSHLSRSGSAFQDCFCLWFHYLITQLFFKAKIKMKVLRKINITKIKQKNDNKLS